MGVLAPGLHREEAGAKDITIRRGAETVRRGALRILHASKCASECKVDQPQPPRPPAIAGGLIPVRGKSAIPPGIYCLPGAYRCVEAHKHLQSDCVRFSTQKQRSVARLRQCQDDRRYS